MREFSTGLVRSTIGDPDLRSPSGFDFGLSPSAQDDTRGIVWQRKLEFALNLLGIQRYFKVRVYAGIPALFFSLKLIKSLLLWEKAQITDKGIRTRVLTLLSSLQEVASVVEYRSKKE